MRWLRRVCCERVTVLISVGRLGWLVAIEDDVRMFVRIFCFFGKRRFECSAVGRFRSTNLVTACLHRVDRVRAGHNFLLECR